MRASPKARRRCTTTKPWKRNRFGSLFRSLDSEIEFGIEYTTAFHGPWRRNMMPSARAAGALGKVPPAPAKHDARSSESNCPNCRLAVTGLQRRFGFSAFATLCCFLAHFIFADFLPFAVPSLPARYHPTTMSEAAAADADTTKVNLVSFSSAVSICFCGVSPSSLRRESRVRDPQSTGTESQSEAGGRRPEGALVSAGFAQPCSDRTGPGGASILSKG